MTTIPLEVKQGVFVEVERYNEMNKFEVRGKIPGIALWVVCWDKEFGVIVPKETILGDLLAFGQQVTKTAWQWAYFRNASGVILENNRSIEDFGFVDGQRLFPEWWAKGEQR